MEKIIYQVVEVNAYNPDILFGTYSTFQKALDRKEYLVEVKKYIFDNIFIFEITLDEDVQD